MAGMLQADSLRALDICRRANHKNIQFCRTRPNMIEKLDESLLGPLSCWAARRNIDQEPAHSTR